MNQIHNYKGLEANNEQAQMNETGGKFRSKSNDNNNNQSYS